MNHERWFFTHPVRSAKGKDSPAIVTDLVKFFSAQDCSVFLVGGYLRDSLLRRAVGDLDVAVSCDPQLLARRLAKELGGSYVPLSPQRGVARIVLPAPPATTSEPPGLLGHTGSDLGITDALTESLTIDVAGISTTIEDDLARRDFTVNAMALPLADWASGQWRERVVDPYNGIRDLAEKRVRTVSSSVFRDDPGRIGQTDRPEIPAQAGIPIRSLTRARRSLDQDSRRLGDLGGECLRKRAIIRNLPVPSVRCCPNCRVDRWLCWAMPGPTVIASVRRSGCAGCSGPRGLRLCASTRIGCPVDWSF